MAAAVERFSMGGDLISEDITSMKVAYEGSPSVVRAPKAEAASSSSSSSTEESKTPSDAAEAGEPLSLATLVAEVRTMLKCGDDLALRARENIRAALKRFDLALDDCSRYMIFDPSKNYTRNLVATDDETFTLMMLCWNPGKESPIHDHPCLGCWVRVIQGEVKETRYARVGDELVMTGENIFRAGQVAYIDNSMGLHKVGSHGPDPAVTLHLYAPPYERCSIWLDPTRASHVLRPVVTYYSEFGEIVSRD